MDAMTLDATAIISEDVARRALQNKCTAFFVILCAFYVKAYVKRKGVDHTAHKEVSGHFVTKYYCYTSLN
jgi:hypothetical protein